jgi:hypothetical protein
LNADGKPIVNDLFMPPGRKRLLFAHNSGETWRSLAKRLRVNFRYVWEFAVEGKLPRNPVIRKKLLGRKSIDEHLDHDNIQDMPPPLLSWAFINREEIKSKEPIP